MKGQAIRYSDQELAWLEDNRAMVIGDYHAGFVARFGRTDVSAANLKALRTRKGWKTGRTGHFAAGHAPHNKGRPFPIAANHPNCRKHQFKKGQEPHNTKYAGHERVSKDGYVEISVNERNPHTGYKRRYVHKHRWLWEQANGPLPDDMALKCLDGDKTNCDPSNWEAIPKALLPRLSGGRWYRPYDTYEPEARPAVLAIAKLEHAVRQRKRGAE
ncbi:HNH endonuclease signature motif containing protein [Microbaculum marinisediminis]|uniref:HNH endonuclease n=1 Tax=Microbaculum marinisediminis TaxID=2931392 RepID=A0AAW5QW37_9HYPH|nr:HNH endonuclease signature motif containing protein [Microbaculum sp. A6E488]MCT8970603.1 HNH endonuclease [Microbaculum sp. A6E488]